MKSEISPPYCRATAFFLLLTIFLSCSPISLWARDLNSDMGGADITAVDLKKLMDSGEPLVVVNVLSELEYEQQHITDSINIPITEIGSTMKLPKDKEIPLVFYCLIDR